MVGNYYSKKQVQSKVYCKVKTIYLYHFDIKLEIYIFYIKYW